MPEFERFFESARFMFRLSDARQQVVCGIQDPYAAATQPALVPPKPWSSCGQPGTVDALYAQRDLIADPAREPTAALAAKVLAMRAKPAAVTREEGLSEAGAADKEGAASFEMCSVTTPMHIGMCGGGDDTSQERSKRKRRPSARTAASPQPAKTREGNECLS